MYFIINALILALLTPAFAPMVVEAGPTCRAELNGLNLLTVVELPTGVAVAGPWQVAHRADEPDPDRFLLVATLDHVVEEDALTGERSVIPFPQRVQLAFEGASRDEAVRRAAHVWCATVMRAQRNQSPGRLAEPVHAKITTLPLRIDAA